MKRFCVAIAIALFADFQINLDCQEGGPKPPERPLARQTHPNAPTPRAAHKRHSPARNRARHRSNPAPRSSTRDPPHQNRATHHSSKARSETPSRRTGTKPNLSHEPREGPRRLTPAALNRAATLSDPSNPSERNRRRRHKQTPKNDKPKNRPYNEPRRESRAGNNKNEERGRDSKSYR